MDSFWEGGEEAYHKGLCGKITELEKELADETSTIDRDESLARLTKLKAELDDLGRSWGKILF